MNFYNEIDPFAAAWLRELIKAGRIAPGVVDERSIEDITPDELRQYTQCHFFAGIGVWSYALRRAGWPDDKPVWTGSCPCQPFSTAGKRTGTADERHLWPAFFHLIAECRPHVLFGEQVEAAIRQGWLDLVQADLEGIGYEFGAAGVPAAGLGAPHIRQRLWFVASTVGDAHGNGRERESGPRSASVLGKALCTAGALAELGASSAALRAVADTASDRRGGERQSGTPQERQSQPGVDGELPAGLEGYGAASSAVEHAAHIGHERSGSAWSGRVGLADASPVSGVALGDTEQPGLEGFAGDGERGYEPGRFATAALGSARTASGSSTAGLSNPAIARHEPARCGESGEPEGRRSVLGMGREVNGHWRDADWLYCRDKKYRPVEPGTFPLAHGSPARVGRLRGYGNAIVAPVAEAFIASWLDSQNESGEA